MAEESKHALKRRKYQLDYRASKRRRTSPGLQDYLSILNEDMREATGHASKRDSHALPHDQQYGLSVWTNQERQVFAHDIARHKCDNLFAVSSVLPNKSVFEVLAMRQEMQNLPADRILESGHYKRFSHIDVPAATEISEDCSKLLDESADYLGRALWHQDSEVEAKRHKHHWLLTQDVADELDAAKKGVHQSAIDGAEDQKDVIHGVPHDREDIDQVKEPTPQSPEHERLKTAIELLDLSMMLYLSDLYYMTPQNGIRQKEPVRVDETNSDEPSLFATAFTDIHNLVVMLTKRLVAASIFQANSRLRAVDCYQEPPKAEIKPQDVASAVDVLGILHNSSDYWLKASRRLKLKVRIKGEVKEERRGLKVLDYSKIESKLMGDRTSKRYRARSSSRHSARPSSAHSSSSENMTVIGSEEMDREADRDDMESSAPQTFGNEEDTESDSAHDSNSDSEEDPMAPVDTYLEALDGKSSAEEELRLWNSLRATPPPDTVEAAAAGLPPVPRVDPRSLENEIDWRDRCDYQSPWERRHGASLTNDVVPSLHGNGAAASNLHKSHAPRPGRKNENARKGLRTTSHEANDVKPRGRPAQANRTRESSKISRATGSEDSDDSDSSHSLPASEGSPRRGRSRHRSSSVSYRYQGEDGMARPQDLPSDSEDEYQPEAA